MACPRVVDAVRCDSLSANATGFKARNAFVPAAPHHRPLTGAGDTCCPSDDVRKGLSVCTPAACPILTRTSQLPANPFFARIGADNKCSCTAPQVCSA